MIQRNLLWLSVAAGALCAGCASEIERPVAEISRARTLIEQAEKAGAQQYAAAELTGARDKLERAGNAADEGENAEARARATEAAADAELAAALAANGEAEKAAREIAEGVETLRRESQRQRSVTGSSNL